MSDVVSMLRSLPLIVIACLAVTSAMALAEPGPGDRASGAPGDSRRAHANSTNRARKLTKKAAGTQIRLFLASATQVTGLPGSYVVETCSRRSARALDCGFAVPGHARGVMQAKLLGRSRPHVQLYVLHVTRTH